MLHERLVRTWQKHLRANEFVHLVAGVAEPLEDWNTVAYLADTVREAGGRPITLRSTSWASRVASSSASRTTR